MTRYSVMDKCRICLGRKKILTCIFESNSSEETSYADMIESIANVKIIKGSGITEKICRFCRKTLQEAYDFKLLIERSDAELNESSSLKKFTFNNINDIKIEIEIDSKKEIKRHDESTFIQEDVNEFLYHDTFIKKLRNTQADDVCLKPVPVLKFLETIDDDLDIDNLDDDLQENINCFGTDSNDDDDDADYIPEKILLDKRKRKRKCNIFQQMSQNFETNANEYYSDGDYIPLHTLLNNGKSKRKYKKRQPRHAKSELDKKVTEVCLKPVYLNNLKLDYFRSSQKCKPKNKTCVKYQQRKLICPHCGILTTNIKDHVLMHTAERKFKCDECNMAFFLEKRLLKHKITRHAQIKDFKCNQCTAAFPTKYSLKGHQIMHNPEMNHVCDICSKAFKRKGALRRHRKAHNSANKTVMCDLCNMSFFTKDRLKHHLRIHTGERPYNCEICSQPYSYKHDFNRHCLKKHGVFLKRRSINVMNEEVLRQERALMKDLMLRVHGVIKDDKLLNPFEGPQAALAFEQAIKALKARQIPVDFHV